MIEVLGERLYTAQEVAEMFHVHISSVWLWFKKGKLDRKIIAGRAYVTEERIKAFINSDDGNGRRRNK